MDKREWLQVLIDPQLKRQLKATAAQKGVSMTTAVEAVVELYVLGRLDDLMPAADHPADAAQLEVNA